MGVGGLDETNDGTEEKNECCTILEKSADFGGPLKSTAKSNKVH